MLPSEVNVIIAVATVIIGDNVVIIVHVYQQVAVCSTTTTGRGRWYRVRGMLGMAGGRNAFEVVAPAARLALSIRTGGGMGAGRCLVIAVVIHGFLRIE